MRAANGGPNVLSAGRYVMSKPGGRDGRAMAMKRNAAGNPWKGAALSCRLLQLLCSCGGPCPNHLGAELVGQQCIRIRKFKPEERPTRGELGWAES